MIYPCILRPRKKLQRHELLNTFQSLTSLYAFDKNRKTPIVTRLSVITWF